MASSDIEKRITYLPRGGEIFKIKSTFDPQDDGMLRPISARYYVEVLVR